MNFLIDQNLPVRLVDILGDLGHEARHIKRMGLAEADDAEIWRLAASINAVIVSKDRDFLLLANRDAFGPGRVHLDLGNCSNAALYDAVRREWSAIVAGLIGAKVMTLRF